MDRLVGFDEPVKGHESFVQNQVKDEEARSSLNSGGIFKGNIIEEKNVDEPKSKGDL